MPEKKLTMEELKENITRMENSLRNKPKGVVEHCRLCDNPWVPSTYNFHGLCGTCFSLFDAQKMEGRFSTLEAGPKHRFTHFESTNGWIEMMLEKQNAEKEEE